MPLDLSTNYGGLLLRSPIVVGACPLTFNTQNRIAIENAGAGAVVLPSLLEEHIIAWKAKQSHALSSRDLNRIDPANPATHDVMATDVETYLSIVNRASVQSSIPVIASLNGETNGDWLDFAGELQAAGADAIELNVHHRPLCEYDAPRDVEDNVVNLARTLRASITVPLFVKLHREYTSVSHLARRLLSGVQGLVLYARDPHLDIVLDNCQLRSDWGLSQPSAISGTLAGLLSVYGSCPAISLAGGGGISGCEDLIKVLLAGADVGMVVSAVYREGPDIIRSMLAGLTMYMEQQQLRTLNELQAKRPLEFSSQEERRICINGLSSQSAFEGYNASAPTIRGDRWGHPL